jgi:2-hydroxy-6-oxonona-2,4-dienedioate hydrolase
MNLAAAQPVTVHTLADVAQLEQAATRHTTPCGDGSVVWHVWGPAGDAPIVLLHGGAGSWTHWVRNITPLVQAGRRVLVPDMPGFGDSARPPDGEDADVLPRWLERGLQQLAGDAAVDMAGFSFGGLTAGIWAHEVPGRVARLVLVGVPSLSNELLKPLDLRVWHTTPPGLARDVLHRHNLLQLMLAREHSADALAVALHGANVERDRMRKRRLMLVDVLARILPALPMPVSGIWGTEDALYVTRRELVSRVLATAPAFRSMTWIDGAGHWVPFEDAPAFDRALAEALA